MQGRWSFWEGVSSNSYKIRMDGGIEAGGEGSSETYFIAICSGSQASVLFITFKHSQAIWLFPGTVAHIISIGVHVGRGLVWMHKGQERTVRRGCFSENEAGLSSP